MFEKEDENKPFNNYDGAWYIEIETIAVILKTEIVDKLNLNSSQVLINNKQAGITKWQMNNLESALQIVNILTTEEIPYQLTGDDGLIFIIRR